MKTILKVRNPLIPDSWVEIFDWKKNPANVFYIVVPLYMLGSLSVLAWAIMIDLRSDIPLATGIWVVMNSVLGFLVFFEMRKLFVTHKRMKELDKECERLLSRPLPQFENSKMTDAQRLEIRTKAQEKRQAWSETKFGEE